MSAAVLGRLPLLVWLTVVWVALWGEISAANLLGGVVLAVALVALLPLAAVRDPARVRPLGLARFLAVFAVDLVLASVQVVVLVLRRDGPTRQGIIRVPVSGDSDRLLTLVANAISLTPGTLTVEVDRASSTLWVHALDVGDGEPGLRDLRRSVQRVERLAARALGTATSPGPPDPSTSEQRP